MAVITPSLGSCSTTPRPDATVVACEINLYDFDAETRALYLRPHVDDGDGAPEIIESGHAVLDLAAPEGTGLKVRARVRFSLDGRSFFLNHARPDRARVRTERVEVDLPAGTATQVRLSIPLRELDRRLPDLDLRYACEPEVTSTQSSIRSIEVRTTSTTVDPLVEPQARARVWFGRIIDGLADVEEDWLGVEPDDCPRIETGARSVFATGIGQAPTPAIRDGFTALVPRLVSIVAEACHEGYYGIERVVSLIRESVLPPFRGESLNDLERRVAELKGNPAPPPGAATNYG